jgi:hypothetical protein
MKNYNLASSKFLEIAWIVVVVPVCKPILVICLSPNQPLAMDEDYEQE